MLVLWTLVSRNCSTQCPSEAAIVVPPPQAMSTPVPIPDPVNSSPSLTATVVTYDKEQHRQDSSFDLEKEVHGDWMTVSRRKRPPKMPVQTEAQFEGLKQSIDLVNHALAQASGASLSIGTTRDRKQGAKSKRRHQDATSSGSHAKSFPLAGQPKAPARQDKGKSLLAQGPATGEADIGHQTWPPQRPSPSSAPSSSRVVQQQSHEAQECTRQDTRDAQNVGPNQPLAMQVATDDMPMETEAT